MEKTLFFLVMIRAIFVIALVLGTGTLLIGGWTFWDWLKEGADESD